MLLLTVAAASGVLLIGSAGSASATSNVVYTQQETQPIPPAANYAGSAGGDGYAVALYNEHVYNVFHHATQLTVACHLQLNASPCWSSGTKTVTDGSGNNFATSTQVGLYIDQATGKLWAYAMRSSDKTAGVVCFDTTVADTNQNPFCGFVPLSSPGEASAGGGGRALLSTPMQVGSRLYDFNYFPGTGAGAGPGGTENTVLCFDLSTDSACAGQPYSTALGTGTVDRFVLEPTDAAIGTELVIPISMSGASRLACFDTTTQGNCSGAWPVATPTIPVESYGAPYPTLDAAGNTTGFCLPNGADPCFTTAGAPTATPAGMTAAIGAEYATNGPAVVLGPRVYVASHITNKVDCYDYAQSTGCPNFPLSITSIGSQALYTVNPDPQRPTCIWVNADNGTYQIQNFDAYTGGPCTQNRVLASQFVVSGQPQCFPTSYTSFQIVTPTPDQYNGGSVQFADGDGNPIAGLSRVPLDATGTADLTGLNLNTPTGLPQFLITLNDGGISDVPLTVKLTWVGPYDPVCASGGQAVLASTSLDANLNDGTDTAKTLTEWVGTPVTNQGTLSGTNAANATGTVTYHWWTDNTCSTRATDDSVQTIATPGTLPASDPVNLPAGVYYETVDYSGDSLNSGSSTTCGSEVLTVNQTPTSITYTGDTSVYAGDPATISFVLEDDGGNVLPNKSVTITLPDGSPYTGTTDANGVLSTTVTAPMTPGSYPVSESFAGQGRYEASTGPGTLQVKPIPTDVTYTGDTSVYIGQPATISFVLKNSITHTVLANQPVTITLPDGSPYSGTTDANGVLSDTITAPLSQGSYPVSESFGGNSPYLASDGPGTLVVSAVPTTITYTGDTSVYAGQPATISFVLKDNSGNVLANMPVTITLPDGSPYSGTTDANGVLSTTVTAPLTAGSYPVSESFGGKSQYLASNGPGSLQVNVIPTNITYTGDTSVTAGSTATVSFVLRDSTTGLVLPNMPVTITLPGGGTYSTTTDANGVAWTATGALSVGSYSVSESFAGQSPYLASSGPGTINVISPPLDCTAKGKNAAKCESLLADPTVVSNTQLSIVAMDDSPIQTSGACAPSALLSTGQQLVVSSSPTSGQPQNYVNDYKGSLSTKYQTLLTINLPSGLSAGSYSVRITVCDGDGDSDQWTWNISVASDGTVTTSTPSGNPVDCTAKGKNATKCESLLADPAVASNTQLTIVAMDDSPIATTGALAPSAVLSNGQVLSVTTAATSGQPQNYVNDYKGSLSTKYQTLLTINLPSPLAAGSYTILVTAYDGDGDLDQWSWPITVASNGTVTSNPTAPPPKGKK